MPAMPPQMPPAGPAPAPEQGGGKGKGASEMVTSVHSGLMGLMDLASGSQAIAPEEKQELGSIITAFQGWVDKLGQAPGAKPPEAPAPQGPVAPEAGGNPNARPM